MSTENYALALAGLGQERIMALSMVAISIIIVFRAWNSVNVDRFLDFLWLFVPKSFATFVVLFAMLSGVHESHPSHVGGTLLGMLLLAGLRQLRQGIAWDSLKNYLWRYLVALVLYLCVGTAWALFKLPHDLLHAQLEAELESSLKHCYSKDNTMTCYLAIGSLRQHIYLMIAYWPFGLLTFAARDPVHALTKAMVELTSDWFYSRIVPALKQRFSQ